MKKEKSKSPKLRDKRENLASGLLAFSATILVSTDYCLAAENLFDKLNTALSGLYGAIAGLATGIFALYCLINFIGMWQGSRDAENCFRNIKRGALAFVAILCLGAIITYVTGLFDGMGYDGK